MDMITVHGQLNDGEQMEHYIPINNILVVSKLPMGRFECVITLIEGGMIHTQTPTSIIKSAIKLGSSDE